MLYIIDEVIETGVIGLDLVYIYMNNLSWAPYNVLQGNNEDKGIFGSTRQKRFETINDFLHAIDMQ